MKAITAVLVLLTLTACGRTDTSTDVAAESNAIVLVPPRTGTLKLRKIYDYGPVGYQMPDGYRYEASFRTNGEYNFPEPIFEGWPIRVTPVDAAGHPTGAAIMTTTLHEIEEGAGRYLELPVGRYRVEELQPTSTAGGGVWSATGANATVNGTTTSYSPAEPVIVDVFTRIERSDVTVVRFFNLCRVDGQAVRFVNDESATKYSMPQACAPTFDTGGVNLAGASLDASFGTGGWAWVDLGREEASAGSVAVLPGGRIIVAGMTEDYVSPPDAVLVRLSANGQRDAAHGEGGVQVFDFGKYDYFTSVLALPDGRIVIAGATEVAGLYHLGPASATDVVVMQFLPDGTRDASFGPNGLVAIDAGREEREPRLIRDYAGRLLLQMRSSGWFPLPWLLARLTPEGILDPSFGTGGFARFTSPRGGEALDLALQPDGKIVVAGYTERLLPDQQATPFITVARIIP